MKKTLLTLFFTVIFGYSVSSQDYIPVIQEGSFWDVTGMGGSSGCLDTRTYRIGGDFVHNGLTYKKLETAQIWGFDNPNDPCGPMGGAYFDPNELVEMTVYIREDVDAKKVYILHQDGPDFSEHTMADFNLEVGDVMTNSYAFSQSGNSNFGVDMTVIEIIELPDGRKRWVLADGRQMFEEGIGNTGGPAYIYQPFILTDETYTVSCYGNNTTDNSSCAAVLSTEDLQLSQIKVFPNPTTDKISFTNLENNSFKLYSILGKEMSFEYSAENQEMDISHLQNGVYLLEIQGLNLSKRVVKILKN